MDYKEKYEQALERAQKMQENSNGMILKKWLWGVFPELKESKDERIREGLIKAVSGILKGNTLYGTDVTREEALTWLEKQKATGEEIIFRPIVGTDIRIAAKQALEKIDIGKKVVLAFNGAYIPVNGKTVGEIDSEYDAWIEKQGEPEDKGEISDGCHTFNELYEYRKLYNAAFFNLLPKELVHKSKRHHDGEECFGGGWFIVMANLPTGQISNHYELKDWDLFQIPERDVADVWDGHTPQEAADRLHKYLLEKQGEQKPTDKTTPKFKVGDKVVAKCHKTDVKTIEKVSQYGTYWTSSKEFYSGWWGEDELEPYVEHKTLDSNKVIAWLVANICDFEHYVKLFKKDFGL